MTTEMPEYAQVPSPCCDAALRRPYRSKGRYFCQDCGTSYEVSFNGSETTLIGDRGEAYTWAWSGNAWAPHVI